MKHGLLKTQIGTPYYMSPEIWSNKPYNESSDMWALGCLIYELCALHPPFLGDSFPQLKRAVLQGRYKSIPRCYSFEMSAVLGKLMRVNPRSRPSAKDLLQSPEVQKYMKPGGYGSIAPESDRPIDLMETIKAPSGPKRHISKVLPKPCYPDSRPTSPESWPVSARGRKESIVAMKNGAVGNLESVEEEGSSDNKSNKNNSNNSNESKNPLPIRNKQGGAAEIVKDARNARNATERNHKNNNKNSENTNVRKALAPLPKNESDGNLPPRPSNPKKPNPTQYGARPSGAHHRAGNQNRNDYDKKPHRPGREQPSSGYGQQRRGRPQPKGYANGRAGAVPGYKQAASVYQQHNNYRRGQYSYKPSWWG